MKALRWTIVLLSSGVLLSLSSCATNLAYYALSAASDYLPDLLEAWLGTSTTTT